MSTAQVANTGIVGSAPRVSLQRHAIASATQFVDPLGGAYAAPPRDEWNRFDDDSSDFESSPRRRRYGAFQDQVISFGGVLVSREIGTLIMQAQVNHTANPPPPFAVEAERGTAVYEFNQALMGAAQVLTDVGLSR